MCMGKKKEKEKKLSWCSFEFFSALLYSEVVVNCNECTVLYCTVLYCDGCAVLCCAVL